MLLLMHIWAIGLLFSEEGWTLQFVDQPLQKSDRGNYVWSKIWFCL